MRGSVIQRHTLPYGPADKRPHGIQRVGLAKPLNVCDAAPDIAKCDLTRPHGLPVDMHDTGITRRNTAAEFGAGQSQFIA